MTLGEILKLEDIKVVRNEYGIMQYGTVDLSYIENPSDFNNNDYPTEKVLSNRSFTEIKYTVYKGINPLFNKELTETELIEFFCELIVKYNGAM